MRNEDQEELAYGSCVSAAGRECRDRVCAVWAGATRYLPQQNESPDYAAHWGYQDGFADGSHDRATGHSFRPTHDSAYKHAPEYGHPPIGRDEYKNIYREAYVHGYEKGYGR